MEMTSYRRFFCHLYSYEFIGLVRRSSPHEDREKPVQPKHVTEFLGPDYKVGDEALDQTIRDMNEKATYGKILDLFCQIRQRVAFLSTQSTGPQFVCLHCMKSGMR